MTAAHRFPLSLNGTSRYHRYPEPGLEYRWRLRYSERKVSRLGLAKPRAAACQWLNQHVIASLRGGGANPRLIDARVIENGQRSHLGSAFSDPGRYFVVIVSHVILGDVIGGRVPDAVVTENVLQRLVEILRGIGTPDIVRMKRQTHHAPILGTFAIEGVELVLDHLQKVIRLTISRQHSCIISLAGIGNIDELLTAPDIDRPRLIIDNP